MLITHMIAFPTLKSSFTTIEQVCYCVKKGFSFSIRVGCHLLVYKLVNSKDDFYD